LSVLRARVQQSLRLGRPCAGCAALHRASGVRSNQACRLSATDARRRYTSWSDSDARCRRSCRSPSHRTLWSNPARHSARCKPRAFHPTTRDWPRSRLASCTSLAEYGCLARWCRAAGGIPPRNTGSCWRTRSGGNPWARSGRRRCTVGRCSLTTGPAADWCRRHSG
jgi:hypothetical protein